MKLNIILPLLALGMSAFILNAQDAGGPPPDGGPGGPGGPNGPGGPGRHRPPPDLIIQALDVNHDGVIDADEIANASAALKKLDKNGDGKLTLDEVLPPPPPDAPTNGHRPPVPPIFKALDANGDGVIDANEIANAPAALKKLDRNGDGKLTPDELRPPRPQNGPDGMGEGPGGPGGPQDGGNNPPPGPPPGEN
jgi:hypothetical protein